MYILKRTDQGGGYVARPGSPSSYTHKLERAQVFASEQLADNARCPDNEIIIAVRDLMAPTP